MYQLNVHLQPGDKTPEGHTIQGWDRNKSGKAFRFHPEFFDTRIALMERQKYWESKGVKAEPGRKTKKVM